MRFELGQIVITSRATELLERCGQTVDELLARHRHGDWGDVSDAERSINEQALEHQLNVVSIYALAGEDKIRIFTRGDRSYTFVHITGESSTADTPP